MSDQPDDKTGRTRDGKGRFDRDPDTAARDAEATRLRSRGWTYQRIADELGISKASAHDAVQRALRDTLTEPADDARQLELARLDAMYGAVLKVLETKHVTVSHGKVIELPDSSGELVPLEDDGPVLAAVDRLLRIQERRAKLLGLDVPARLSVDAENIGREIAELITTLSAADDRTES